MRLLVRHFLRAFFSGGIAQGADPRAVIIAIAAVFACPGVVLCILLGFGGAHPNPPCLAFFIALSMLVSGLLALLLWDHLLLERADFLILRPLPLPVRNIVAAKIAALAALVAGFIAVVNIYSGIFFPLITTPGSTGFAHLLRVAAAQALTVALASAWLFLVVLAVRAALAALAPRAEALAGALRLWLTVALLCALALSLDLLVWGIYARLATSGGLWTRPLFWFVGLDRVLAGMATPTQSVRGREALLALALTAAAAAVLFALACWRQSSSLATPPPRVRRRHAGGLWLRRPRPRAVFAFARATLTRSRPHGLRLSLWLGAGIALIALNIAGLSGPFRAPSLQQSQLAALALPLVLCFFLALGLRQSLAVPIFPQANWVFRLAETGLQPERLDAARSLLWFYVPLPVLALTFPFATYIWGWRTALLQVAYCAALAGLLIELLLLNLRKLPFTCPYVSGRANVKYMWPLYWLLFTIFAYGAARIAYLLRSHPLRWLAAILVVAAAAVLVYRTSRVRSGAFTGAQFEDHPDPTVQTLLT